MVQKKLCPKQGYERKLSNKPCPECTLKRGDVPEDVETTDHHGRLKPLMYRITLHMYLCPMCNKTFYDNDFFR